MSSVALDEVCVIGPVRKRTRAVQPVATAGSFIARWGGTDGAQFADAGESAGGTHGDGKAREEVEGTKNEKGSAAAAAPDRAVKVVDEIRAT